MVNLKESWRKSGAKTIIVIFIFAIVLRIASAATWTQYTPSPTTNDIVSVVALSNGHAFAYTESGINLLLYNGVNWTEISSPSSSIVNSSYGFYSAEAYHENDRLLLFYVRNQISYKVVELDTNTLTYDLLLTQDFTLHLFDAATRSDIVCLDDYNKCFVSNYTTSGQVYELYPSYSFIASAPDASSYVIPSDNGLLAGVSEWNGVSWVSRYPGFSTGIMQAQSISSTTKYYCSVTNGPGIYELNVSSGKIYLTNSSDTCMSDWLVETGYNKPGFFYLSREGKILFLASGHNMRTYDVSTKAISDDSPAGIIFNASSYDHESNIAWAVGGDGIIYMRDGSGSSGIPDYTLTSSVSPNPVNYGTTTNFYATPITPYGETSNISVNITNSTGDWVYGWTWLNVPSGYTVTNDISGIAWNNFNAGNYTITMVANRDPWNSVTATPITWVVTTNAAQNRTITNYTWTEIDVNTTNIFNTFSVTDYGADVSYATGVDEDDEIVIMSIDHSNPNNLVIREYVFNDTIKTADLEYSMSIDAYDERLYLGTDNELFVFNTSRTGRANDLVFIDSLSHIFYRDNIKDVAAINDTYAITCNGGGILGDEVAIYNYTSGILGDTTVGINPCESVYYIPEKDIIIIHKGDEYLWIINNTDYSDVTDLTVGSSPTATQDQITHSSNSLFFLTNYNEISKYTITNPANPTLIAKCRTDRAITSIESMNENEVIIGKTGAISVCDFDNSDTYYSAGGYYIAQLIKSFTTEPQIYELSKNSANKFVAATEEGIKIFLYGKINQTIEVNQPPTITSIGSTDTTPCIGQQVKFTINAADPEGDEILYEFYCRGNPAIMGAGSLSNEYPCTYSASDLGTITVTAFAKGYTGSTTSTKYQQNIQVQNCTADHTIFIKVSDYDTGIALSDVYIVLSDGQSTTSDSTGNAYFSTSVSPPYNITATNPDYRDYLWTDITDTTYTLNIRMKRISGGGTTIIASVKDYLGNALMGATVSATDISTGQNKYAITEPDGIAVITQMFPSNNLIVSAAYTGYTTKSITTTIIEGQTRSLDFVLESPVGGTVISDRGCVDLINDVWLCGNLSVTGIGSSCAVDADCISDRCSAGVCSSFNWEICDERGINRGQYCVINETLKGFFDKMGGLLLTSFIAIITLVIIIFFILLLRKKH